MIIKKDKSEIEDFLVDAANFKGNCSAVYFPENEAEIVSILREANNTEEKVTVAGNGTGLTGGRVPEEGIVVSMANLDKIIEINSEKKSALLQPGVLLADFQNELKKQNLFYPPDPTEQNCFIGATVATNSSGAKSFKYGATRNFVLALRIVLPTGDILNIERGSIFEMNGEIILPLENGRVLTVPIPNYEMPKTKHSAGYFAKKGMDAIDLFIGSEGTLGIITQIKVKLLELPENLISGVLFFKLRNDALDFVDSVREKSIKNRDDNNKINARGIEYFDFYSLQFLKNDYPQINDLHQAAIWIEQEINSENEDELFNLWMNEIEKFNADLENSWFATNPNEIEKFKNFRHAVSEKVSEYISKSGFRKVGTDTAVPVKFFRKFYRQIEKKVIASGIEYVCYGHIGDCHLHLNMLPKSEKEFENAKKLYRQFCKLSVSFGGTISAEHGIGKIKKVYLLDMFGETGIREMAKTKKSIDSNTILGIGNIFERSYLNE